MAGGKKKKKDSSGTKDFKVRAMQDLFYLLAARAHGVWLVSTEERRVESLVYEVAQTLSYDVWTWDVTSGGIKMGTEETCETRDALELFKRIDARQDREVWIVRDIGPILGNPVIVRGLKTLLRNLENDTSSELGHVVVLGSESQVPRELASLMQVMEWPLPSRDEIEELLQEIANSTVTEDGEDLELSVTPEAVDAVRGLTADDVCTAAALSIVEQGALDPQTLHRVKKRVVSRSQVLTWEDPDERGLDAVGGLENLKVWLTQRRRAFSPEAREVGLPTPKGCLLWGVQGCGKSATARAVAAGWGFPLLRLDVGALRGSLVGQSEANIRRALAVAESVAPCVLWVEEIEKALAGSTGRANDSGVSADQLATLLHWMQRQEGVFVVATCNNAEQLPPELKRVGRFDRVWFIDLPHQLERPEIIRATLVEHGRELPLAELDVENLVDATKDFSGAECAAVVVNAMYMAFEADEELTVGHLLAAAADVQPMSVWASEQVQAIRDQAGRAYPASKPPPEDNKTPRPVSTVRRMGAVKKS